MVVQFEFLSLLRANLGKAALNLYLEPEQGQEKLSIHEILAMLDKYFKKQDICFLKSSIDKGKIIVFLKDNEGTLHQCCPGGKCFYSAGQTVVLSTPLAGG